MAWEENYVPNYNYDRTVPMLCKRHSNLHSGTPIYLNERKCGACKIELEEGARGRPELMKCDRLAKTEKLPHHDKLEKALRAYLLSRAKEKIAEAKLDSVVHSILQGEFKALTLNYKLEIGEGVFEILHHFLV